MINNGVKAPCGQGCPRRAVGCRSSCEEWQAYEAAKAKEYHDRQVSKSVYGPTPGKIAACRNVARRKKRGRKG